MIIPPMPITDKYQRNMGQRAQQDTDVPPERTTTPGYSGGQLGRLTRPAFAPRFRRMRHGGSG